MAYQQPKTILDHAEQYHRQVADFYRELMRSCENPRVKMLLDYLGKHEGKVADSVRRCHEEAPEHVLATWLTTTQHTDSLNEHIPKDGILLENLQEDDVLQLAMQLDDIALDVYQELASRHEPSWVAEAFQNLLEIERSHERLMVRQAERGGDL